MPQNLCPRCGFPLRFIEGKLWCNLCRTYPLERRLELGNFLTQVEDRLRGTLASLERRLGGQTERPIRNNYHIVPERTDLPPPRVTITAPMGEETPPSTESIDDKVFNYIQAHNGEISLSTTAAELEINMTDLQASISRLRSESRLGLQDDQTQTSTTPTLRHKVCVRCSRLIEREARYCTECGAEQLLNPYG